MLLKKVFTIHISDKGLVFRVCKGFIRFNKKANNPIKKKMNKIFEQSLH